MTGWVFTFGHGQRLRSTNADGAAIRSWEDKYDAGIGWPLHDRYVAIDLDHDEARLLMFAIFGRVWSMEYEAGDRANDMIAEYELRELDVTEPLMELAGTDGHKLQDAARRAVDAKANKASDAECTHGADCSVHPNVKRLHGEVPPAAYVNLGDDTVNGAWST